MKCAVRAATGVEPDSAGKPSPTMYRLAIDRAGASAPLVVGDRLDTDIEAGHRTGIPSLLVLTGVTGVDELLAAPEHRRPTYVAADLRGLADDADALAISGGGTDAGDGLDALREQCRLAWAAADAGASAPVEPELRAALVEDVRRALAG